MKYILSLFALLFAFSIHSVTTESMVGQERRESLPPAFTDIGKTLAELEEEYPDGIFFDRPDGYPDAAVICFGDPEGELAYVLFGAQAGDYSLVLNTCGEELRCAGLLTTAGTLFPEVSEGMELSAFLSRIGVSEYDYVTEEEASVAAGWALFSYDGKAVWLDTDGKGPTVDRSTHLIVTDREVEKENRQVERKASLLFGIREETSMRLLFEMVAPSFDPTLPAFVRPSARGIILREGRVAMVHSRQYDYYKFPGGGIEPGEDPVEALIREVREESGLVVLPGSVREYGLVRRAELGERLDMFVQDNYYYLCQAEEAPVAQALDDYEREEGYTLEWVTPETAIAVNRNHPHGPASQRMLEREARVLELLRQEGFFP